MPITYEMLREGRVALFTFPGTFTMAEVTASFDAYQRTTLDKAAKKVYTISDLSAVIRMPPNILTSSIAMIRNRHPMTGPMIEVTPNTFINELAGILSKVFPSGTVLVYSTVAEALQEADRLIALETPTTKTSE